MEVEREDANTKKWRAATVLGGAATLGGIAAVAWLLADFYREEGESEAKVKNLRMNVGERVAAEEPAQEPEASPVEGSFPVSQSFPENPYAELFCQNEDMAAWLVVDGTVIDYPVMQTEDEEYYLYRDFYGNEDRAGCLILDADSLLYGGSGTTNLIIHGHNMKAGTMFGGLDKYKDEDYYQEHKYMELYTREEKRDYEVIAAFYSQVYYSTDLVFKYYNFFKADNEAEFRYFYDNIRELSLYDTGVTAELGDHFLTLSTCAYHVEDGRFVVVAKETDREVSFISP